MLKFIGKQFRQPSGILGRIISTIMEKANSSIYNEVINILNLKDKDKILEIGYGSGQGINKIVKRNKNVKLHGLDFSKLMYEKATRKNSRHIQNNQIELFYGDVTECNTNILYDKILAINVVYFWKHLEDIFNKLYQFLSESGELILFVVPASELNKFKYTNNEAFIKYDIDEIIENLRIVGYQHIKTKKHKTKFEEDFFIIAHKGKSQSV
ncbi:class I SAM-dependent methyltransferase [Dethiothermospora halolimnae]|uniref:class I SAM-dependent methyltransferase n=1 Tax=Dethiothermospora halolimnae TaxID=3114390 RepID=UPI003CCB8820